MREIGGYIELDTYHLPMLHENAIALNCGRNALAYLFRSKGIKRIKIPFFICSSIPNVCDREGVDWSFYHINTDFIPDPDVDLGKNEWLYLVNFYGQLCNDDISKYVDKYKRVIVDNANAFFQMPLNGVDTIYTCRKWFGVADGAFLYTDTFLNESLPQDESFDRMTFLLGRYERSANEFFEGYKQNNAIFTNEPIKKMSKLTYNLLHGIDYDAVKEKRLENFRILNEELSAFNLLNVIPTSFMYPFYIKNGCEIREQLQSRRIYIPVLWPYVFNTSSTHSLEFEMANNILPIPIDQRYDVDDLEYVVNSIKSLL